MTHSRFADPTGLDGNNTATAEDLVKLVRAAHKYDLIKQITTTSSYQVDPPRRAPLEFRNTNTLVKNRPAMIGASV